MSAFGRCTRRRWAWPLAVVVLGQVSCVRVLSSTPSADRSTVGDASTPITDQATGGDAGGSPHYYIATDGSDDNPGTADRPWLTWSHALELLQAGDTLVVKDGLYGDATPSGLPVIDCRDTASACGGKPCRSGQADASIRIVAEHERRAWLKSNGSTSSLRISGCSHIEVVGLRVSSDDRELPDGSALPHPVRVEEGQNITLRRLVVARPNRFTNVNAIFAYDVDGYLVEECEVYEFHKVGIAATDSSRVTIRRNYVNGRGFRDIAGGFVTTDPGGADHGIRMENVAHALVENNVVEDVRFGVVVSGYPWGGNTNLVDGSNDNRVLGNLALAAGGAGFFAASGCNDENPCVQEDRIVRRARFVNNIAIACAIGFYSRGTLESVWSRNSSIDADLDYRFDLLPANAGLASTFAVDHCLDTGTGTRGYHIESQTQWTIDSINSFGNSTYDLPAGANATNAGTSDPELGTCLVYVPATSPLRQGVAPDDRIGADIVFRTVDGEETSQRLWDPVTGAFPCGATVDDVNGSVNYPDSSCVTMHRRLNVGANGCPVP